MTEGQKPDDKAEIEGILADLESILSEKAPDEGKPKTLPGIANIVADLGDALKQTKSPTAGGAPPAQPRPPAPATPPPPAAAPPPPPTQPPSQVPPMVLKPPPGAA